MRSKLVVAMLLLSVTSWVGCSYVKNIPKKRRYTAIQEEVVDGMEELNQQLASIRDEGSLQAALPQIRTVLGRVTALIQEAKQLQADIGGVNARKEKQMVDRLKPIMTEMQSQFRRIGRYRGAQQIAAEMMKLSRVALAPPPPPSAGSRPSSPAAPNISEVGNDLKALGLAYHRFINMNRAAPKSWEELLTFCSTQGDSAAATSVARLQTRGAVVFFGINFREATIGTSNYVLGFEKSTPKSGGWALLLDGATMHMTPARLCGHLKVQAAVDRKVHGRSPPQMVMFSPNVQKNPEIPPHLAHLANQPTQPPGPPSSPGSSGFPTIPKDDTSDENSGSEQVSQNNATDSGTTTLNPPGLAGSSTPSMSGGLATTSGQKPEREVSVELPESSGTVSSAPADDGKVPSPFGSGSSSGSQPSTNPPSAPAEDSDSGAVPSPFSPNKRSGGSTAPAKPDEPADDDSSSPSVPNPFGAGSYRTDSGQAEKKEDEADKPVTDPFQIQPSGDEAPAPTARRRILDSETAGGSGGSVFRHVGNADQVVVGIRYRLAKWLGKDRLGKIEPLFANSSPQRGWEVVEARAGYAIGAIQVDGDKFVNAVRLAFMRIEDGRLNTRDKYVSDWIGTPEGSHQKTINCDGAQVVGIFGRGTAVVDAIGLVFVK